MTTGTIVTIVVVIVVLVLAAFVVVPLVRRRRLREKFGPEYERAVETHEDRGAAERELREREKRYAKLEVQPLQQDARERYTLQWAEVQERFVDDPEATVNEADRLVTALMSDRGYPTEGYEEQLAYLSVEHSQTLDHYRAAHDTQLRVGGGGVSTEDLRAAMVHYRSLFEDLLGPDGGTDAERADKVDRADKADSADLESDTATDGQADQSPAGKHASH